MLWSPVDVFALGLRPQTAFGPLTLPLLEREEELAALRGAVEQAAAGRGGGGAVVIRGEAGVGKSALLAHAATEAEDAGMQVATARGFPAGPGTPLALASDLLYGTLRELSSAECERLEVPRPPRLPGLPLRGSDGAEIKAAVQRLVPLVGELAARQPLALFLDDAHRADPGTLRLLARLATRAAELPLLVCLAADETPDAPRELAGLVLDPRTAELRPSQLGADAVAVLLRARFGPQTARRLAQRCHRETAGNAFLLAVLLSDMTEGGGDPGQAGPIGSAMPRVVAEWVERRGNAELRLAQAIAVTRRGETPFVAGVAGLELSEAERAAEVLGAAGILAAEPPLRARQPLVERSLRLAADPLSLAPMHRRAGRLLCEANGDPRQIAEHLLRCEPDGHALGQEIAETPDPARRAELRLCQGEALCSNGRVPEGIEALEAALRELDGDDTSHLRGRILGALLSYGRPYAPTAARSGADLRRRGASGSSTPADRAALACLALHRTGIGACAEETAAIARRAIAAGAMIGDDGPAGMAFLAATWSLSVAGVVEEAEAVLDQAVAEAQDSGSPRAQAAAHRYRSVPRLIRGDLDGAAADAETVLALGAEAYGPLALFELPARFAGASCRMRQGRAEEARALLEVDVQPPMRESHAFAYLLWGRASQRLAAGDAEGSLSDASVCGALAERLQMTNPAVFGWRSTAAEAAMAVGATERARALCEKQLKLARNFGAPHCIGAALRTAATIGDDDRRPALLEEAVAQLRASAARLELGEALAELGAARRRAGRRRAARRPLSEALDIADRLGAGALAERARGELLIAGARPRRNRLYGSEALTAREREVCRLAMDGHGNAEIAAQLGVSINTVATHLRNAYAKLGIGGRDELSTALNAEQ